MVFVESYQDGRTTCKRLPSKSKIEIEQKNKQKKEEKVETVECDNTQPSLFDFTNPKVA